MVRCFEEALGLPGVEQWPFEVGRAHLAYGERLRRQGLEVARLAATGLSNPQIASRLFLSPRTVSSHLYRVFPKLGITSRAGLRDALEALPPEPPATRL
ncbi:hypothetical protein GCM10010140_60390 [Streptosporangium pseudovulgare]|uniref:HTH luxR-type domain-containing protein n=2 Tax=Streptosporangium pseudovulgare TaxID=35765 RepID=A0ABQ2RAG2_9ACTN|nr:hypothetical protein GCM10010140_60390 [Streptosporangium pseudovulgare]